jgi:hypothetical protein
VEAFGAVGYTEPSYAARTAAGPDPIPLRDDTA